MEHKALAALMVRLVGLWELVVAVNSIPSAIGPFPSTVATQVLRIQGVEPKDSADATLLERVAVSALGLWFTVNAVFDGVHAVATSHIYRRFMEEQYPHATGPAMGPGEFAGLIVALLQLALGLWLLLGSRGLANAFARLRG